MLLCKPGAYEDILCLKHMWLEGEMESLEHSLQHPDFEKKERGGGGGLEVTPAVVKTGEPWLEFTC